MLSIETQINSNASLTGPIWLSGLSCVGTEGNIAQCISDGWGVHYCSHQQDVYLECSNNAIISNDVTVRFQGLVEREGVVEVKIGDDPWGTVCTPSTGVYGVAQVSVKVSNV